MAYTISRYRAARGFSVTEVRHNWPRDHIVTSGSMTFSFDASGRSDIPVHLWKRNSAGGFTTQLFHTQSNSSYSGTRTFTFTSTQRNMLNASIADGTFFGFGIHYGIFNQYKNVRTQGISVITLTDNNVPFTESLGGSPSSVILDGVAGGISSSPLFAQTADIYDSFTSPDRDWTALHAYQAASATSGQDHTYGMWCRPSTSITQNASTVFAHLAGTDKNTTYDNSCNYVRFGTNIVVSGIDTGIPSANYHDGNWHHFALTASGSSLALYINGVMEWTGTHTPRVLTYIWWSAHASGYGTTDYAMHHSDATLFRRVLSDEEIATLYSEGRSTGYYTPYVRVDGIYNAATSSLDPLTQTI